MTPSAVHCQRRARTGDDGAGKKASVCLIIASYHNYLLFDFSMYVIRMFQRASEKCERSDVSFNMTRAPLMKHCCNMC